MITDEEIKSLEEKCRYSPTGKEFVIDKRQFYRAIYQLGRQHQRESDAVEIETMSQDSTRFDYVIAIRNNTGELN